LRKFVLVLVILALLAGAVAAFLIFTTPGTSTGVRFPLAGRDLALVAKVPADAEAFAVIPDAAGVHREMKSNPVLRDLIEEWTATQRLPAPWMIGGGDLVAWRTGKQTSFAIDLDPIRAAFVRLYLQLSNTPSAFLINAPAVQPIGSQDLAEIQSLSAGLPPGDLFVVQRRAARGAFPPIGRPAATSVEIQADNIVLTSRAIVPEEDDEPSEETTRTTRTQSFPTEAIFSASFSSPPRIVEDLNRLFGAKVSSLFSDGGAISIFEVDTGTLLPRPRGVIVLPSTERHRQALRDLGSVGGLMQSRDTGDEILVTFDRRSIDRYLQSPKAVPSWPATRWMVRADPARLVPVLEKAGDNLGLRIAAPRLHRAARDLRRWMGNLAQAQAAEAAATVEGRAEELRVRIATARRN
jgi:hypothetical protein